MADEQAGARIFFGPATQWKFTTGIRWGTIAVCSQAVKFLTVGFHVPKISMNFFVEVIFILYRHHQIVQNQEVAELQPVKGPLPSCVCLPLHPAWLLGLAGY